MSFLRRLFLLLLCLALVVFCGDLLFNRHGFDPLLLLWERSRLARLDDYDYVTDIEALRREGHLSEALELARYVRSHPDLPGHDEAAALEIEIDGELRSLWGRSKRTVAGFVTGEGETYEALGGAILSDMVLYGDLRDLAKQGYYKATGQETDPLLVALSSLGLLTEVVDAVDWAPAALKVFRKAGAMSKAFGDGLLTLTRGSVAARRLDPALGRLFSAMKAMKESVGLPRTMTLFRHVDDGDDLAFLARAVARHGDEAYLAVRSGGRDGVRLLRRLDGASEAGDLLGLAARKGPRGVALLLRPPSRFWVVLGRGAKALRLGHLRFVEDWAARHEGFLWAIWGGFLAGLAGSVWPFLDGLRGLKSVRRAASELFCGRRS